MTKFGKEITVLLLVGSLAGCFLASPYYKVNKSGANAQKTSQDNFECQRLSQGYNVTGIASDGQGVVTGGTVVNRSLWTQCLQGRGYSVSTRSWSDHADESERLKSEHTWLTKHWQTQYGINREFDQRHKQYQTDIDDFIVWQP